MRTQIVDTIFKIARQPDSFDQLEAIYSQLTRDQLAAEIVPIGIMPEIFDHDSSEEKLWSKLSDIFLATCLSYLGLTSRVMRMRGNSADVFSSGDSYTLVSDAKCFRLSRTAKNQKDFKIKALDDWRRQDTFALLVAPLYQYPLDKSQIYPQAITRNVTLLSYTHLRFLLEKYRTGSLKALWEVGVILNQTYSTAAMQTGIIYWQAIDTVVCDLCGLPVEELKQYKQAEVELTRELGQEGITYWQDKKNSFASLSREEAINLLIQSQKIEQKIETIKRTVARKYVV